MTHAMSHEEIDSRLRALQDGPWKEQAARGVQLLSPGEDVSAVLVADWLPMASVSPLFAAGVSARRSTRAAWTVRRERQLARLLRPHWEGEGISGKDIGDREAVDQALGYLQLVELGVEMGYVPEESVRDDARRLLLELLWSSAARGFVRNYDYLSLYYLAARFGVDIGQGHLQPPEVRPRAAIRFSAVLAEHSRWYSDDNIGEFVRLMDDIHRYPGEQQRLSMYLATGRDAAVADGDARLQARLDLLATGAEQFVIRLCNIVDLLDADELARVGLLYAYWLAKFFGWELDDSGYRQVRAGWAQVVARSASTVREDLDPDLAGKYEEAFQDRIAALRRMWDAVRELEQSVRAKGTTPTAADAPAWIQIPGLTREDVAAHTVDGGVWLGADALAAGICTVPVGHARRVAPLIAAQVARLGRLRLRIVGAEGDVTTRSLASPPGKAGLTTDEVMRALTVPLEP